MRIYKKIVRFFGEGVEEKKIKSEIKRGNYYIVGLEKLIYQRKKKSILGWKGKYNLCCHKRVQ